MSTTWVVRLEMSYGSGRPRTSLTREVLTVKDNLSEVGAAVSRARTTLGLLGVTVEVVQVSRGAHMPARDGSDEGVKKWNDELADLARFIVNRMLEIGEEE